MKNIFYSVKKKICGDSGGVCDRHRLQCVSGEEAPAKAINEKKSSNNKTLNVNKK